MATARKKGKGYEIRVYCGVASDGKRLDRTRMWIPAQNMTPKQIEKELERQKFQFEAEVKTGIIPDSNIRLDSFIDRWMDEYAKVKLAHSTYIRYVEYVKRIKQGLGHMKLKDIKPMHINAFLRNLEEDGMNQNTKGKLAPVTVLNHYRTLSKILNTAVKWGLLGNNPCPMADPPNLPRKEITCLDEKDTKRMILLLNDEPIQYRTMIVLLLFTGMRRGELCGLEWKDINFDNQTLNIVRSSQYIGKGQMITKEPKTKAGIRRLSLSSTACAVLKKYKLWQDENKLRLGDTWVENDRLFTQWNGEPIHPDTITWWFAKFIKSHNFPYVKLHSLRHTNATLMIAEGTDVATVSKRLGHANTAITLSVYTHALKSKDAEAAEKLDNILAFQSPTLVQLEAK